VGEEPGANRKREDGAQAGAGFGVQGGRDHQDQHEDNGRFSYQGSKKSI